MNSRILKKCMTWMCMAGLGGTCFQLSSCDESIRGQILTGLNSATDTLLTSLTGALFTSLTNSGADSLTSGNLTTSVE